MSTSIIDLPENLRPAFFLRDVEDGLTERSLTVVNLCKGVWRLDQWESIEEASQEAERLWRKYGEQTGHAVAFLWLADLYWKNGRLESAVRYCEKAMEHVPNGPAPAYRITKAVAYYMCGLTHQMSDRGSAALESYQESLELFLAIQSYWKRVGNSKQVGIYTDTLEWLRNLIAYVSILRLNPPAETDPPMTLVYPCRASVVDKKYILAELTLAKPVSIKEVKRKVTSTFLSERSHPWGRLRGIKVDGYKVGGHLRVLGMNDGLTACNLNVLNPDAQYGRANIVLPAGAPYYAFQVESQPILPAGSPMAQDDYLLAWSSTPSISNLIALPLNVNQNIIFERDSTNRVHFKEIAQYVQPAPRILGGMDLIDFGFHPA